MFDVEWNTFKMALREELASEANRYVVIVGDRLLGVFDTYNAALEAGYKAQGLSPFLLKRVPPAGVPIKTDTNRSMLPGRPPLERPTRPARPTHSLFRYAD
jgi:hypothetical protein